MKDNFDLSGLVKGKSKRINSKAKGGRFERKIAEILNKKFNTKDFCRTPGSGAFATTHHLPEHLQVYGDLITPKDFKFIIECKSGYNKEGIQSLLNIESNISDMIAQARRDSNKCSKKFLLILGQDRREPIVITDKDFRIYIDYSSPFCTITHGKDTYYLLSLDTLLKVSNSMFL